MANPWWNRLAENNKARLQNTIQQKDTSDWLYRKDEKVLRNNRDRPALNSFSIHFRNEGSALQAFETMLFSFFEGEGTNDKAYEKTFRLVNTRVLVRHSPKIIGKAVLLTTKEGSVMFNKNKLAKLLPKVEK